MTGSQQTVSQETDRLFPRRIGNLAETRGIKATNIHRVCRHQAQIINSDIGPSGHTIRSGKKQMVDVRRQDGTIKNKRDQVVIIVTIGWYIIDSQFCGSRTK